MIGDNVVKALNQARSGTGIRGQVVKRIEHLPGNIGIGSTIQDLISKGPLSLLTGTGLLGGQRSGRKLLKSSTKTKTRRTKTVKYSTTKKRRRKQKKKQIETSGQRTKTSRHPKRRSVPKKRRKSTRRKSTRKRRKR